MKNEVLLKAFEQMANDNKYVNSVRNIYSYRDGLGLTEGEKEYIRRCARFGVSGIGRALAEIISTFEKEEYEFCNSPNQMLVIKKKEAAFPEEKDRFNTTKDYIVLAIGRNDCVAFYAFDKEYYVADCNDRLDYPFPYVKEFIDEVIKFRIKYGIKEIADYGLEYLAAEFIKAREEQLEVGSGARVRCKKSSQ